MAQIPGGYLVLIRKIPYGGRKIPRSSEDGERSRDPHQVSTIVSKDHKYLAEHRHMEPAEHRRNTPQ